jgi:hypothetical protein
LPEACGEVPGWLGFHILVLIPLFLGSPGAGFGADRGNLTALPLQPPEREISSILFASANPRNRALCFDLKHDVRKIARV